MFAGFCIRVSGRRRFRYWFFCHCSGHSLSRGRSTSLNGSHPSQRMIFASCHKTLRCSVLASTSGRCKIAVRLKGAIMKIVVIGGTGLIGSKLINKLRGHGHEAVPASPNSGVNTLTGEGLAEVLKGASVVVDVSNSPSFDEDVAMNFFKTATRNLIQYELAAGVRHHVALSVVGTDQLAQDRPSDGPRTVRGYFRAKLAQEKLIAQSSIPYSIVHATQFFEFVKNIADTSSDGTTVRLAPVLIQPMAADDVAAAVGRVAIGPPANGVVEVGGPE